MHLKPMSVPVPVRRAAAAGFSLVEVLVTLVVVSVGMLGLAKLQAAAVSESSISRTRSLMSLQAESLAAAMRGNRTFWAASTNTLGANGNTITDSTSVFNAASPKDCTVSTNTCTASELAVDDFRAWVASLNSQFGVLYTASVTCQQNSSGALPNTCDIQLNWSEGYVATNRTSAASSSLQAATTYIFLHVEP